MRYAVARDVAWHAHRVPGEAFPTVYAMACPDGQPYVLAGTSALIWQALVDGEVGLVGTFQVAAGLGAATPAARPATSRRHRCLQ